MLRIFLLLGIIFSISCYGQIWQDRIFAEGTNLYDIAFRDSLTGAAVGDSGLILNTTDGGVNWIPVKDVTNEEETVFKIQYLGDFVVYTGNSASNGGFFLKYSFAEKGWTKVDFPYKEIYLTDSHFLTGDTVFVCGLQGKFLRSFDGMQSWEEIDDPNNFFANRRILFTDSQNGWITGGRIDLIGFLKRTTDGGVTWEHKLLTIEPMLDIIYVSDDTLFAAGGDPEFGGWIYISSDGGETWIQQVTPPNVITLGSINFQNHKRGWATGAGSILYSSDFGNTWEVKRRTEDFVYRTVLRTNRSQWFAGTSGFLSEYIDTSGGDTTMNIGDFEAESGGISFSVYPNPSNSQANVSFSIEKISFVKLELYDILGRLIKILFSENLPEGSYSRNYDFKDLPSGIYFLAFTDEKKTFTNKFIINK